MAMPEMEQVKDLALKYPKNILGRMAQLGQISSTLAVMAGMMRDRIVQAEIKPPTKTVAQEVLPADSMGMEGFSDPTAMQPQQPVMRRAGGLARIPVRENMYEMAGGGIVAFQAGGSPSERIRREFESLPVYKAETEGIPGAELFSFMGREMRGDVRIDPETGKPVSFGEYLRLKDEREARAAQEKGLGAAAATTIPSTAQTAVEQAAVEDPMRGQSDVGYIPPEVFAADQKEAQARNAAALAAAREAAPAPTRQAVAPPQAAAPTQVAAAPQDFDISAEAKRIADAKKAFLGEDPYTKYLTEQLEKGGEQQFTDRALRALQMIQAGEQIREGRAGAETALPTLLKQRQADVAAKEARAEKLAQLKGREYEGRAKAFEAAYGKGEELSKEERAEKRGIEKEGREARRRLEEAEQKQEFSKELIRLQKSLTPQDFNRELLDYAMGNKGSTEQQSWAKEVMQSRYSVTSAANRGKLTEKQAYDIVAARPENFNKSVEELQRLARQLLGAYTGGGGSATNYDFGAADALVGIGS